MRIWKGLLCAGVMALSANFLVGQTAEAVVHKMEWSYVQKVLYNGYIDLDQPLKF